METFTGNVEHENLINKGDDERRTKFLRCLPQGYRFHPSPQEVILKYLIPKINNGCMPAYHDIVIPEVDVYERNPGDLIEHENLINKGDDERRTKFLRCLPQGYRFHPSPQEVILKYLIPKINNGCMPAYHDIVIPEVDVYERNPGDLIEAHALDPNVEERYFITSRKRKYREGRRPARRAGNGYWKPSGADEAIIHKGNQIGLKKVLDFYNGRPNNGGTRTDWKMHEYKIEGEMNQTTINDPLKLDAWVICKIYKTRTLSKKKKGTTKVKSQPVNNTTGDHSNETGPSQLINDYSMVDYLLNLENSLEYKQSQLWP